MPFLRLYHINLQVNVTLQISYMVIAMHIHCRNQFLVGLSKFYGIQSDFMWPWRVNISIFSY